MDLPASCGSRRSGPAGLEPATRCRSKHQVRRVASGAGTLHRQNRRRGRQSKSARQAGKRFSSGSQAGDSRREDSLSRVPTHNYPSFLTGGRDPSRVIPLIGQACRAISRPSEIGRGRCSCLRPSTRKSSSNILRWLPIGQEVADKLAPLRLAERGAMPIFGAKSKTPMSKETPPGTLDSAHGCA